jgi:hypothetical protein
VKIWVRIICDQIRQQEAVRSLVHDVAVPWSH